MKKLRITEKDLRQLISKVIEENKDKIFSAGSPTYGIVRDTSLIREGLIMSYEPNHVINIINKTGLLSKMGDNCSVYGEKKGSRDHTIKNGNYPLDKRFKTTQDINALVQLGILAEHGVYENALPVFRNIERRFNACGYYFSGVKLPDNAILIKPNELDSKWIELANAKPYCQFLFEPKYDRDVNPQDIPVYCYHICETSKLEKILSQGLKPASGNRRSSHPERVYLFLWKPDDWHQIADAFSESRDCNDFTLLQVNTNELRNKIKFCFDQNTFLYYPDAIYTFESIPAQYIKPIDQYLK